MTKMKKTGKKTSSKFYNVRKPVQRLCRYCFYFTGRPDFAAYAIFLAAIFDFFDGFASRVLKSFSGIGKDLDSLADMVSFGVLPSVLCSSLFLQAPQIPNVSFI
jgi:phosphatidylserine synthase